MFYTIRKILKLILIALYRFFVFIYNRIDKELEAIAEYLDGIKLAFAYQKNDRQFIYKVMYQKEKIKVSLWICTFVLLLWGGIKGYNKLVEFQLTPDKKELLVLDSLTNVQVPKDVRYSLTEKEANLNFTKKILFPHITKWEGGYGWQKHDAGGETMRGITWSTYKSLSESIYGVKPTKERFLAITPKDTEAFIEKFMEIYRTDRINHFKIQIILTELYWGGNGAMLRMNDEIFKQYNKKFKFQKKYLNRLDNDFILWVNKLSVDEQNKFAHFILSSFIVVRSNIAARRVTQNKFLSGWNNRYHDLKKQIDPYIMYEVKSDDEKIEDKFTGLSYYQILELNKIDKIKKGQKLIVKQ